VKAEDRKPGNSFFVEELKHRSGEGLKSGGEKIKESWLNIINRMRSGARHWREEKKFSRGSHLNPFEKVEILTIAVQET